MKISTSTKKQVIGRLAASIAVSAVMVYALFKAVTGHEEVDIAEIFSALRHTALYFIAAYAGLSFLQIYLRALRYKVLIRSSTTQTVPSTGRLFLVTMVRNMLVDLFPARIGELSYLAMLNRGCGIKAESCLSSFGIAFVFDFMALSAIIAGITAWQALFGNLQGWLLSAGILVLLITAVMAAVVFFGLGIVSAILNTPLPCRIANRYRLFDKFRNLVASTQDAIIHSRRSGILLQVFALSIGLRLVKYSSLYILFKGVASAEAGALASAGFAKIITALLAAEGMASMPVPSFMSFGTYESGGLLALVAFGFSKYSSMLTMLTVHIWSQFVDYSIGITGFIVFLFSIRDWTPDEKAAIRRYSAAAICIITLLAALAAGSFLLISRHKDTTSPQRHTEAPQIIQAPASAKGIMVWASNRSGNHELYVLNLPAMTLRKITDNPLADYSPKISPDGKLIAYARAKQEGISFRDFRNWTIRIIGTDGTGDRQLSASGCSPSWSSNGNSVIFVKDGSEIVSHDINTGTEHTLLKSGSGSIPEGVIFETPMLSPDGTSIAVTFRGNRRGTMLCRLDGTFVQLFGGCQVAWAPDGNYLYYVDRGGKQDSCIYKISSDGSSREILLDLPGEFSHIYFPKISNDGLWLVLGASAGGHEHDQADYEIFLWRMGSDPDSTYRLTYDPGNDSWPDIHMEPQQ